MKGLDKPYRHQRCCVSLRGNSRCWKRHHKLVTLALLVKFNTQVSVSVISMKQSKQRDQNQLVLGMSGCYETREVKRDFHVPDGLCHITSSSNPTRCVSL